MINEEQLYILIGRKIRFVREKQGISQQDLAAWCNIEKSNLCRIESGRTNLTLKSLFKISKSLNIHIRELMDVEIESTDLK
jgi:transcriptional regulator with XRE-family HTH domain